ncbi:MAG: type IIA DNA topoisomerase subunit B [Sphaerochaetaceae bacterium]|nr:type IIA DNA topoisomerase subunit B [Sphaerochaetaceae bacterium]
MNEEEKNQSQEDTIESANAAAKVEGGSENYTGESFKVLKGLEAVRVRPGMYIGSTGYDGLHHMVYEVVDNSIDEAVAGYCDTIRITIEKGNIITVEDNGRGIPVDIHPTEGVSTLEVALCRLHAGGKFDSGAYKVSGGLHGVGVSVVNALSETLVATVCRAPKMYRQVYHRGEPEGPVVEIGTTDKVGTTITFHADAKQEFDYFGNLVKENKDAIMEADNFNFSVLCERFRELAFLNSGVTIIAKDNREESPEEKVFHFDGGIKDFVSFINKNKKVIPEGSEPLYFAGERSNDNGSAIVEFSLQYNDRFDENIHSFANNINTREGGKHLVGFTTGLVSAIRSQLNKHLKEFVGKSKSSEAFFESEDFKEGFNSDVREGLSAVVSIKITNPQFEGQTKMKLGNSYVQGLVQSFVTQKLNDYFDENPQEVIPLLEKTIASSKARIAAKKARENARKKSGGGLPGKLADCSEKDPAQCEIFIVEGDSAGGSAKQGRDRRTQAILPLWGKMLNVEKVREDKVDGNDKLQPIIDSIGAGFGNNFDVTKARYHKVVIMADADVDGSHIRTLLLTFFFRYMRPLIEAGFVYFAMPPLYKVSIKGKDYYAFDDEQKDSILSEHNETEADSKNVKISRYKGLGEMNPEQLWETTMDPERRYITRVELNDAVIADQTFSMLMGEEVEPRRVFIEENATYVKNLDA